MRQTHCLADIDYLGEDLLTKNNTTPFFLFKENYPKIKLFVHGTEVTILASQWCVSVNVRILRHVLVL